MKQTLTSYTNYSIQVDIVSAYNMLSMMYICSTCTVDYHASEFHDETYTVFAPNTRTDTSYSIPLNVNLDSGFFYTCLLHPCRDIVARLKIQSTFHQLEVLVFMQPDESLGSTYT